MKPHFQVPVHDGSKFDWTYSKATGHGTADAGDLGHQWNGRIWNDSCDEGFIIRSHVTGVERIFTLVAEHRNAQREITSWVFTSYGSGPTVTVTVYND